MGILGPSREGPAVQFDHAGVATDDVDRLSALYEMLFNIPAVHEERFDGLEVVFLDLGGDGYVELIEPVEDGPIERYLAEHGPGIHHLALSTEDIDRALETCREHDVDLIDEEPRPGAWGHVVAFLHPASTGGILIELVEH